MEGYDNWMIGMVFFAVVFMGISIFLSITRKNRIKQINKENALNKHSGRNMLHFFYRLFLVTPGINRIFHKVIIDTESVYPADMMSVNKEATKLMLKNLLIVLLLSGFTVFFTRSDLWYLIMGLTGSFVIFYQNIQTSYEKKEYTLLLQLKDALSTIRHNYTSCWIVEDAIYDALEDVPYEISLHLEKIYNILVSPTFEEDTEEYTQMSPNRFLLLMLSIASSTKEYNNGEQGFLKSLSYLEEEIGQEILKKNLIYSAFRTMQSVSIICIFLLKPIQIWSVNNMPETRTFYASTPGKVLMVLIFLVSFGCFYMIDVLKEGRRGEIVRETVFSKISTIKPFSMMLNRIINHRYMYYLNLNEDLKEVGDQTGPKAFVAKQIIFACAAFICINTSMLFTTVHEKLTMLKDYVAEFDESIVPNEEYRQTMEEMTKNYIMTNKGARVSSLDRETMTEQIKQDGIHNDEYARIMADEVVRELTAYKNTYYKWYILLISLAAAALAYYIPLWYLKFRIRISTTNKDDEVNQFNTLVLILSNADGIKLDEIMEWLSMFAYSFKSSIDDCINDMENGEQKALEKLKDSESNDAFRRFVDSLLMIDSTDLKTAFSNVEIERAYSLENRKQRTEDLIHRRSRTGGFIAMTPFLMSLVLYLMLPMLLLAAKMYMSMDLSV